MADDPNKVYVKLPDGSRVAFPQGTPKETMKSAIQKHLAKAQGPAPAAAPPAPNMAKKLTSDALGLFSGIGAGVFSTLNDIGSLGARANGIKNWSGPFPSSFTETKSGPEALGKGAEQVGEYMIPWGGPEKGLGKIAAEALQMGAMEKLHGGSFGKGAAMGGLGGAAGELAPKIFEKSLDIASDAKRGAPAVGAELLDNKVGGIRKGTITENVAKKLKQIDESRIKYVSRLKTKANLSDALKIAFDASRDQMNKGETTGLKKLMDTIESDFNPISQKWGYRGTNIVNGETALKIRDGISRMINWDKSKPRNFDNEIAKQVLAKIDEELASKYPKIAGLNKTKNSLELAQDKLTEASHPLSMHRIFMDVKNPTRQVPGIAGMLAGHAAGGWMGGLLGGAVGGLGGPIAARGLSKFADNPFLNRLATGSMLEGTRGDKSKNPFTME
jgi:hypothetical protein